MRSLREIIMSNYANASRPTVKVNKKQGPRGTLTGRMSHFIDEYMANGQNGAAAYRKAYRTTTSTSSVRCGQLAYELLRHLLSRRRYEKTRVTVTRSTANANLYATS